jgi:hypothetical protein
MSPRRPTFDPKGSLSRKRTADLLKTLRKAKHQARMLKARIERQERKEAPAATTRRKR